MKGLKAAVALFPFALAAPVPGWADGFNAALRASAEGRHGEAAAAFYKLAHQGDGEAAYNLALLFATGRGVPQNDREALYWVWRARLADIPAAPALLARLWPSAGPALRKEIAERLEAYLHPLAQSGDGAAMLQLAAVMTVVRTKPDPVAAHGWQSIAAALDVPGALAARDATLMSLPKANRAKAQDQALAGFADWCAGQTTNQPPACVIVADKPPTDPAAGF
jgi:TPR repeat protein